MIFNPLEQFEVGIFFKLFWVYFFINFDLSITIITIIYIIVIILIVFYCIIGFSFEFLNYSSEFFKNRFLHVFLMNLMRERILNVYFLRYFPFIYTLMILVFYFNVLGLWPLCFSVSSQICQTFGFALTSLIGITIIGCYINKFNFILFFLPSGVSFIMVPFLFFIEIISYLIRPFSLSIRLFANMLAGHILIFIIISFGLLINCFEVFILFHLIFFLIYLLEFCIAFIQTYVFIVLICIYLNDVTSGIKH